VTPRVLRSALHASTALLLLTLLDSWQLLKLTLLAAGATALVVETVRLSSPAVAGGLRRLVPVFRDAEGQRPSGAAWLFVAYALAAWLPPPASAAAVLAGALADPAAALVGGRWGAGVAKSWPGTAAALAVGTAALLAWGLPVSAALAGGVLGAALERWPGPFDDNLLIAPGVGLVVWLLL
jgi:dolichol kinase